MLWLAHYDVDRHTIKRRRLPKFVAAALLPGYAWLAIGGVLWLPTGIFINADRPMRSLRSVPDPENPGAQLLQIGGSAYVADPNTGRSPWDELEDWGRSTFAASQPGEPNYRWSTQDFSTGDGLPIIGRIGGDLPDNVYCATGFGGWGLTTAALSAELFVQQITGKPQMWHDLFSPQRELKKITSKIVSAHRTGLDVDPEVALATLKPREALVLNIDGEEVAAYRDEAGELQKLSAVCTHIGGIILWNEERHEWECPCHGSCFSPTGEVTNGPAKEPLPAR